MSTTTRGEAAYLNGMLTNRGQIPAFEAVIEQARAEERRATVQRIRDQLITPAGWQRDVDVFAVLNEEEER